MRNTTEKLAVEKSDFTATEGGPNLFVYAPDTFLVRAFWHKKNSINFYDFVILNKQCLDFKKMLFTFLIQEKSSKIRILFKTHDLKEKNMFVISEPHVRPSLNLTK